MGIVQKSFFRAVPIQAWLKKSLFSMQFVCALVLGDSIKFKKYF